MQTHAMVLLRCTLFFFWLLMQGALCCMYSTHPKSGVFEKNEVLEQKRKVLDPTNKSHGLGMQKPIFRKNRPKNPPVTTIPTIRG